MAIIKLENIENYEYWSGYEKKPTNPESLLLWLFMKPSQS